MRLGGSGKSQRVLQRFLHGFRRRVHDAETLLECVFRVGFHQIEQRLLLPALRRQDLHFVAALFAEQLLQRFAILEIHRHVDAVGDVLLVEINLLEQRGEKFVGLKIEQIFPEVFAAIHDAAIAQVEQIGRHQRRLGVASENVDVLAFGGGDLLLLLHLLHGRDQIAQPAASSKRCPFGCLAHARAQIASQIFVASFQEQLHVANRGGVRLHRWLSRATHGPRQRWM
jgi:hypothetical protein